MCKMKSYIPVQSCTRIYLFRHGEVINPNGVFYGQQDVKLSRTGRSQSRQAAENFRHAGISGVFSSDLSRCRFMAETIADFHHISPVFYPDLREVDFGRWTGLSWQEIDRKFPGAFARRMHDLKGFRPPGGENLADVQQRIWTRVQAVISSCRHQSAAIISHGGTNRVLLATVLGMPLDNIFSIDQGLACANIIDFFPDGIAVVRAINLTGSSSGHYRQHEM